jgi:hypothetical protein
MSSPSSEDRPEIRSRTGKFLQGMLGKVTAQPGDREANNANDLGITPSEFFQQVTEPTEWDDEEESNWDDDFVEAPPPFTNTASPAVALPPPPPPAPVQPMVSDGPAAIEPATQPDPQIPPSPSAPPAVSAPVPPPAPPSPEPVAQTPPKSIATESSTGPLEVNIPRPKNIKYKSKPGDPPAEPKSTEQPVAASRNDRSPSEESSGGDAGPIELNIKRPSNIKYKAKPPEPTSFVDKLLAPFRNLGGKFKLPNLPSLTLPSLPLPNLAEDRRKVLSIAAAVFLSLTAAWATINFWPSSSTATIPPTQSAPVATAPQPVVPPNPEATLVNALQSKLQALAGQYPVGLIANLELTEERQLATVLVSDRWFSLSAAERQQMAQSLWQQAVAYGMAKLEVRSATDQLLARSPVVGGSAIVVDGF